MVGQRGCRIGCIHPELRLIVSYRRRAEVVPVRIGCLGTKELLYVDIGRCGQWIARGTARIVVPEARVQGAVQCGLGTHIDPDFAGDR
ncbi:conserved hypothetical protein, partial [Ricinus communis]